MGVEPRTLPEGFKAGFGGDQKRKMQMVDMFKHRTQPGAAITARGPAIRTKPIYLTTKVSANGTLMRNRLPPASFVFARPFFG